MIRYAKLCCLVILLAALLVLPACGAALENPDASGARTLVACFSCTGNTEAVAQHAADILGADFYAIVPQTPYTADDLRYTVSDCRANLEQNDKACRPALAGEALDVTRYDTVILAYPIWWGEEPRIIDTFVETYDLTGKTLLALCTSGGSGIERSVQNLQAMVPGDWRGAKRFSAGTDRETVAQWLGEALPGIMEGEHAGMAENTIHIQVGSDTLTVTLADNESARALKAMLADGPRTIPASNYGGFEKVCALGQRLPSDDVWTSTQPGDVMLFSSDQIVLFHGNNAWFYTRLGWIQDADAQTLARILGGPESEITILD